jgi:predicted kinase
MSKIELAKPVMIGFYGFPGSGKSYVSRNLSNVIKAAHVNRIRSELFQTPRYDAQENAIVTHLMTYMTEEFLNSGISVIYDLNQTRAAQRRNMRELAKKYKAEFLLVWLQIDIESAFGRTQNRDRRTQDDKYAQDYSRVSFDANISPMQNPQGEDYLVVSGKHSFITQKNTIINKLYQMGVVSSDNVQHTVTKPELINLVPNLNPSRVDFSRRNINIR